MIQIALTESDADNDGIANSLDLDSDNDGVWDIIEAGGVDADEDALIDDTGLQGTLVTPPDQDNDSVYDFLDIESSNPANDGTGPFDISNTIFSSFDTNGDGLLSTLDIGGGIDDDQDGLEDLIDARITAWGTARTRSLSTKVLLFGPYQADENKMNDFLRQLGLIPLMSPYEDELFAANNTVITADYNENAIVDWVEIIICTAGDYSLVLKRSALLQRDGDVVDINGLSPVLLKEIAAGNYHVRIRHRNHLEIMTDEWVGF